MPRSESTPIGGGTYGGYVPRATEAPKRKKKGGVWSALKNIGGTTLKALTVPGAVVVTGVNAATGGDADWSDLGGAFTAKDGKGAGFKLAKRFGASDRVARIAGLAPEILLDPTTYMTGGLSASAKVAGGAARLRKLGELKALEQTAKQIAGPGAGRLVIKGGNVGAAGFSPKVEAQLIDVAKAANAVRRELETMGGVPAVRFGVGRKAVKAPIGHPLAAREAVVKVPRGIEVRFGSKVRMTRDPSKGNALRQSAYAKEAKRNLRAVEDLSTLGATVQKAAVAQMGITDEEMAYVDTFLALRAQKPPKKGTPVPGAGGTRQAELWRRSLVEDGKWRPEMDALVEVYTKTDRESAEVLGLKIIEDQLADFADVTARASDDAARLTAQHEAAVAIVRGEAAVAKAHAAARIAEANAPKAQAARAALDEVEAALPTVTGDARAALVKRRRSLRRTIRTYERAAAGLAPVKALKAIDLKAEREITKLNERFAGQVPRVWDDAAQRFAVAARLEGFANQWGLGGKGAVTFKDLEAVAGRLATVGGHYSTGMSPEMLRALGDHARMRLITDGVSEPYLRSAFDLRGAPDVRLPKKFASPTQWKTETRFIEEMTAKGVPEDIAIRAANYWRGLGQKFAEEGKDFWPKSTIPLQPDADFFRLQRNARRAKRIEALGEYTKGLLHEAFPLKDDRAIEAMLADIAGQWDKLVKDLPTSMRSVFIAKRGPAVGESRFAIATTWLKMWYTNFNPIGHYVMNATGSFANSLIQGSRYHWSRGALGALGFANRKLSKMDKAAMEKTYKVGQAGEMTGLELHVLSALSGLGAPYSRAEISNVLHLIEDTKEGKARWLARHLNNFQMDRENADRLYSFMNHVRNGDDAFTAGSKVVRYAFDYDQLTHFEKVWLRNLLIFYTWFRKNLTFQGYGVMTRPGIYAALAKVESSREKKPGEPEWWAKAGGFGTPMGLLTFGNPYADVFKYSTDFGDARRTVFSSLTPFVKLPIEMATEKDLFTGAPIQDSTLARLKHVGKAVMGPQGKLVETAIKGVKPGQSLPLALAGRFLGPKIQQDDPAGNAMRLALQERAEPTQKRKDAAKRAAETRKRRQLERYNQVLGERP